MSSGLESRPSDGAGEFGYSRLSLLAVASFGLGGATSIVVLLGFAISLFRDVSFLLPTGYLGLGLIPLAGLLAGWIALGAISSAEGALSGKGLARLGIVLSISPMLLYGAYHGATTLALQMRAEGFLRQWVGQIASENPGDRDTAFVYTLSPGARPSLEGDSGDVRAKLEIEYNQPQDLTGAGPYTTFHQSALVQLLGLGNEKPSMKVRKVSEPNYVDNGYELNMEVDVETSQSRFRLDAHVHSALSNNLPPIKKWQIRHYQISSGAGVNIPEFLGDGRSARQKVEMARKAAMEFSEALDPRNRDFPRAYSFTLPGSRIPRVKADNQEMGAFFRLVNGPEGKGFVQAKAPEYWASPEVRNDFMTYLKAALDPDYLGPIFSWFALSNQGGFPRLETVNGRARVRFPVRLLMIPKYVGMAQLEMSAPMETADRKEAWLVDGLIMISARMAPMSPEMKNAPPEAMNMFLRKR